MYLHSARDTKHRLFSYGRGIQFLLCPYHQFYPLWASSEESSPGMPVQGVEQKYEEAGSREEIKWRQDHEKIYFFISNHIEISATWGKARRSTLAGRPKDLLSAGLHGRAASRWAQGDKAGPQYGCRILVCCSDNLMPPAFPADSHSSGINLLSSFLHDQIFHRLFQVLCGVFPLPSIRWFASLHTWFMTESSLDDINIGLLFFSNARVDTRAVTNSQLVKVSL